MKTFLNRTNKKLMKDKKIHFLNAAKGKFDIFPNKNMTHDQVQK